MSVKASYKSCSSRPVYAGSAAVATLSADGSLLATPVLDEINLVQLGDTQKLLYTIENDDEQEINALKLTPDGRYLCYTSQAQLLKIFNVSKRQVIRSMKISSPSYILDIDSTSTLVAIGGTDGSITIVDIENGYITHSFKGHGGTISCLKFYGEAEGSTWLLASGDTNGMVKIWDLTKRKCLHTVQEHSSAVRGLDFQTKDSESELQLVSGGRDNVVNIWELNTKKKCKLILTLPVHQQVETCGFINSGTAENLVYTAGGDAIFQIISLDTEKIIKKTSKPAEELFIIGALPIINSSQVYLVFSDQTLGLVDPIKEGTSNDSSIIEIESYLAGNHGTIADMKIVGPNANLLALATNSPTVRLVQIPNETAEQSFLTINVEMLEGHKDLLNSLDKTEDGMWMATASKDNSAILWHYNAEVDKYEIYCKFVGHVAAVTAVGLPRSSGGSKSFPDFLLTASNDLTIKKWKIPEPSVKVVKTSEYTRRAHEKDINALSVSPNDSVFATASYDKTCKIWDTETGELQATLANHKRGLWDVSFCQYDKLLATCSGDRTIKLWSLDTYSVVKTLEGHSNTVQRCSFINKQKQLVSTCADGLIKIWDCDTGDCIKTLDGHGNRIWALTVVNDGERIMTADADGVFQIWDDCTAEEKEQDMAKEKLKVEQEQSLQNYLSNEDWTNAFLLAMSLDHPMRLFNVLKQSLSSSADSNTIFNKELDKVIATLDNDQVMLLMRRCRDWNTNARTFLIAQKTIRCILLKHNISEIIELPGMMKLVESIIPYTERHFNRVDNLVEQSYLLDYALVEMDKLL